MPLLIIISGIIVKGAMSFVSGAPLELKDIISVSVKAIPWAFVVGALKYSVNSIVSNMHLVTKIYFPRALFPISYVFGQMFDFLVSGFFLACILIFAKIGVSIYILWMPVIILFIVILTLGLAMIFACGNVFFRDLRYIIDVLLTFAIFFTPVFYEVRYFARWKTLLLLNPLGSLLEALNDSVVLHRMPDPFWLIYACSFSLIVFFLSIFLFYKNEPLMAEYI